MDKRFIERCKDTIDLEEIIAARDEKDELENKKQTKEKEDE